MSQYRACDHGWAHHCQHLLPDPRGAATTDPKNRPGWRCQQCRGHRGRHADFKADGRTSRTWTDEQAAQVHAQLEEDAARPPPLPVRPGHPLSQVVAYEGSRSQTGDAVSLGAKLLERASAEHPVPPCLDTLTMAQRQVGFAERRARYRELIYDHLTHAEKADLGSAEL